MHEEAQLFWVDRTAELQALRAAILRRESKLICGPPDSGKTALLFRALSELPARVAHNFCRVSAPKDPAHFLSQVMTQLTFMGNPVCVERLQQEGVCTERVAPWWKPQPSLRMRGLMFRALGANRYWILVDHAERWTQAAGRLLYDIAWRGETPVILLTRSFRRKGIGYATRLFWHGGQRIELGALHLRDAKQLLDQAIVAHGLTRFELSDFRKEVLAGSGLLPGAILKMCALASQSRYHFGRQIKARLVRSDYLMESHGLRTESGPL
jgi:hypothetical protein